MTEVNPQGTSLVYSTFLAGSNGNFGNAIAVDTNANAYIAGSTFSQSFPAIALAYQGQSGNTTGLSSAFVSMISHNNLPGVALTPQKIAFGNVTENTTATVTSLNVPSVVTVLNAGTAPLQISGVATTGDFSETNNCVGTLPAGGGVCTINVSYTPTVLAPETELLSITDNAAGSPHLVTLTGTGVTGIAQVQFSPTSLVFPATTLNTTSASQTVTMTNNGQTPLTVTNIAATGDFAQTNTCPSYPFTMAVGGSCSFSVTFTPTNTGVRKGSLTITDNVTSGSSSIALTGTGNPNFTLSSPTTSQFLPIGTTTTTFTIIPLCSRELELHGHRRPFLFARDLQFQSGRNRFEFNHHSEHQHFDAFGPLAYQPQSLHLHSQWGRRHEQQRNLDSVIGNILRRFFGLRHSRGQHHNLWGIVHLLGHDIADQ